MGSAPPQVRGARSVISGFSELSLSWPCAVPPWAWSVLGMTAHWALRCYAAGAALGRSASCSTGGALG